MTLRTCQHSKPGWETGKLGSLQFRGLAAQLEPEMWIVGVGFRVRFGRAGRRGEVGYGAAGAFNLRWLFIRASVHGGVLAILSLVGIQPGLQSNLGPWHTRYFPKSAATVGRKQFRPPSWLNSASGLSLARREGISAEAWTCSANKHTYTCILQANKKRKRREREREGEPAS